MSETNTLRTYTDVIDDKTHPYLERNQSFYQKCAKIVCSYPVLGTQQLDSLESAVHKHPKIGRIARYTLPPPRSQLATTARRAFGASPQHHLLHRVRISYL